MLSPNKYQVKIGKTSIPVLDPINLDDQTDPVASEVYFQAYQKAILVGIPIKIAERRGLSLHHLLIYCKFN